MPLIDPRGEQISSAVLFSFLVGVISSSIVCWWTSFGRKRGLDDTTAASSPENSDKEQDRFSWMLRSLSMEDIASRIGELPSRSRRMHWPWNKPRKTIPEQEKDDETDDTSSSRSTTPVRPQEKTGPCIGSIFGLDAGGTLAKLVYFEQGTTEDHSSLTHRQLMYHRAASAQVVLEARRAAAESAPHSPGHANEKRRCSTTQVPMSTPPFFHSHGHGHHHSISSDEDLQDLYRMRQESVPAHLSEYGRVREPPKTIPTSWKAAKDDSGPRTHKDDFHLGRAAPSSLRERHDDDDDGTTQVKTSQSMLDLSVTSRDHAEALDRFYSFARRLDTYETTVKDKNLSFYSRELGGEFHFIRFETRQMHNAMDLIRVNKLHLNIVEMGATGGGAHKYAADWDTMLGIQMVKQEELDSLVAGMQFVLSAVVGECYTYRPRLEGSTNGSHHGSDVGGGAEGHMRRSGLTSSGSSLGMTLDHDESDVEIEEQPFDESGNVKTMIDRWWYSRKVQRDVVSYSSTYPYLLVTIGTGVSVLRVDDLRKYTRVSGSTIGGGTYWGLIRLLTDVETFEDAMDLAGRGDPSKVDMMVGDIYGQNKDALEKLGLPSDLVASSFGKLVGKADPASDLKQEDLARALLLMITINIGQVAYLNAQLYKTPRIYFVGNFLRHNTISQRRLSYAIDYWSKGKMEALFLEHEGYFGALGAFLLSQGITNGEDGFWKRKEDTEVSETNGDVNLSEHRRVKTMHSFV